MAVANAIFGAGSLARVEDIEPGWSIQEDATSIDILDTSGSTGQVSATFKRKSQGSLAQTPDVAPIASSEYLLDQPSYFIHPTLGGINGYITDESSEEGAVSFNQSTILDVLNADIDAPVFGTGSQFYSFTVPSVNIIYDIVVNTDGDIWVAGDLSTVFKYSRFGQSSSLDSFLVPGGDVATRLGVDSAGNVYGMSLTAIYKFNITTRAVTSIVTGATKLIDMKIDPVANFIYVTGGTTSTTIWKYNTAGALQTSWASVGNQNNNIALGLNYAGNSVYHAVNSTTSLTPAITYITYSNTGTLVSQYDTLAPSSFSVTRMAPTNTPTGNTVLTLTSRGITANSVPAGSFVINSDTTSPVRNSMVAPYDNCGLAADPNGMGFYYARGTTITRFADGMLSPYQALECYIGMAGFGVKRNGQVNYTNLTTTELNTFDGGVFPSWSGNCWSYIKQLAARSRFYITANERQINVTTWIKPQRQININNRTPIQKTRATATGTQVTVVNQKTSPGTQIYTSKLADGVVSADIEEISTTTIDTGNYPISIVPITNFQGTAAQWVGLTGSYYMVVDSSTIPLLLSNGEFTQYGGSVTATRSLTSPTSVDITMTGPRTIIPGFTGPFSLAYGDGSGAKFSAIMLAGNGVLSNPEVITMLTGASDSVTSQVNIQNIDSPFVNNASVAYDVAQPACIRLGHGEQTLNFSIPLTDSHVLGNIAGSVFLYERTKWRITSTTISSGMINVTAGRFTSVADVTPVSPTITVGTHDALWTGTRIQDNFLSPGIIPQ